MNAKSNIITLLIGLAIGAVSMYFYHRTITPHVTNAIAAIYPAQGSSVKGKVTFQQTDSGVRVHAKLNGLTPGKHGFHIHELGDCGCDDAKCALGHFNPTGQPHAAHDSVQRHAGDLGNIVADRDGNATLDIVNNHITLNGPHSIIGRSVIIHADPDDFISQPSGNAGARIGRGTIGLTKEQNLAKKI